MFIFGYHYPFDEIPPFSDDSLMSVEFNGVRVGGNCNTGVSPYILYSYYERRFSIRVAIYVRIEKALLDGMWNESTTIKFFGPRKPEDFIDNY